jgi:hypothetical protein
MALQPNLGLGHFNPPPPNISIRTIIIITLVLLQTLENLEEVITSEVQRAENLRT